MTPYCAQPTASVYHMLLIYPQLKPHLPPLPGPSGPLKCLVPWLFPSPPSIMHPTWPACQITTHPLGNKPYTVLSICVVLLGSFNWPVLIPHSTAEIPHENRSWSPFYWPERLARTHYYYVFQADCSQIFTFTSPFLFSYCGNIRFRHWFLRPGVRPWTQGGSEPGASPGHRGWQRWGWASPESGHMTVLPTILGFLSPGQQLCKQKWFFWCKLKTLLTGTEI